MRSGRIRKRALPTERATARICREAGAVVKTNVLLRDLNVGVSVSDERRLEVLAHGLPLKGGSQLAIDVTLRSVLSAAGIPKPRCAVHDGIVAESARQDKERKYPELLTAKRCELVVLALETGGRWSQESMQFVFDLATAKAQTVQQPLRSSTTFAFVRRWTRILSVAAATSFARSLILPTSDGSAHAPDGYEPPLCSVVADACR